MSAKPANAAHDEQAPAKKGPGIVVWALVCLVSGGAGFFVPMMLTGKQHEEKKEEKKEAVVAAQPTKLVIVPFDSVIVNLNEVQPHFLRFSMSLEVDASQEKVVTDLINEKKVLLQNWLLVHLGDKGMDDVRGGAGEEHAPARNPRAIQQHAVHGRVRPHLRRSVYGVHDSMTAAAVQTFDPRHARGISADARRVADRWLRDASIRMNETFAEFGVEAKVSYQQLFTQDARTALSNLPDPDAGALFHIGKAKITAVMSFRTGVLLSLVHGQLGIPMTEWPADRALTPVEMALAKMLFERFAAGFSDAWPSRDVLATAFVRPVVRTARARLFDPAVLIAVARLQITTPAGDDSLLLVTTHEQLEQLCGEALPAPAPKAAPSQRMADLAPLVPLPFSVELGRVQLTVSEAESLKLGDVLVLDQTTRDLLTARVAGRPKFQGRPGRVGGRVCFAIDEVMEE